jgi:hypothetical protein
VEAAERFADGLISEAEFESAGKAAGKAAGEAAEKPLNTINSVVANAVENAFCPVGELLDVGPGTGIYCSGFGRRTPPGNRKPQGLPSQTP